ncbi:1,4-beta-xylanase, partial [Streptomyces sp. MCAF7]
MASRTARTLLLPLLVLFTMVVSLLAASPSPAQNREAPSEAAQPKPKYAGYLFTYFTGEGTADGEQIRMALSRGNDPLHWRE